MKMGKKEFEKKMKKFEISGDIKIRLDCKKIDALINERRFVNDV